MVDHLPVDIFVMDGQALVTSEQKLAYEVRS
jgi:hypothetical protein